MYCSYFMWYVCVVYTNHAYMMASCMYGRFFRGLNLIIPKSKHSFNPSMVGLGDLKVEGISE